MPRPKAKEFDFSESIKTISESLRRQATRPNVLAYSPHIKQQKFHASPKRGRLYIGGNRSGKTVGGIVEDVWWLTGKHPYRTTPVGGVRGRIVSVDFTNGIEKIILPELARWLPPSELKNGSWIDSYSRGTRTLTLANGSFVELMSYDQDLDKFAGTSRHFTHFDEEPPQDIYIECMARLIDTGGSWWMTMTPVEGMSWIYDDIYLPGKRDATSNVDVIEIDMTENPFLSEIEVQQFISTLSKDEREARVSGKFVQLGGLVYKSFDRELHVIEPFMPPKEWEWYTSFDHGYNNPTAVLWHAVSPDNRVVTFAEHYEAERTIDYHANIYHMRNAAFGRVPDYNVGDPAMGQRQAVSGVSIFQEYASHGIAIAPANNDVDAGINRVNQYLKIDSSVNVPRWQITANCTNLIAEMQRLRWKTWANKKMRSQNNKHEKIHKKDDHACDSARYFFSFLPDLTPVAPGHSRPIPVEFGKQEGPLRADEFYNHFDNQLMRPASQKEWTIESLDETLGGVW